MAAGLAQEFPVNLLDFGILMRFAQRLGFVLVIKRFGAQLFGINVHKLARGKNRLAASRYAAAGAAHHFYEMILLFSALNFFQQLGGVARAVGYGNSDFSAVEVYDGLLYAFRAAYLLKIHLDRKSVV